MVTCVKYLAKISHAFFALHHLLLYLAVLKFLALVKYRVSIQ